MTAPARFTQADIKRAIKAATGLGYEEVSVTIGIDGQIQVTVRTTGYGDRAGTGWLCFPEDALDQEQDEETGKWYQVANLANSELIFLRDTLNTIFPKAMAAKDAEIEGLREMLRVVEDPDRQLCCSGRECGCMGSTVGQYAAWAFRDTAAKDAELAELRAEVERLRGPIPMPIDIAEALAAIGEAEWGATEEKNAQGHAASVRNSVELTAAHFSQSGPQKMHGVYIKGDDTVICHTGTSPNSGQHARAITAGWNFMLDHARAAIAAMGGK